MAIAELFIGLHNHKGVVDFSEVDRDELEAIALLFPLNFDETGNQIKAILEKRYTDGISGFEGVKVEGSKIVGVFSDIVSPALTKKFNFSIDADTGDVDYTQIDTPTNPTSFGEYEFAAPGSKSKQCKEGKSSACTRSDGSTYCIKVGYKCKSVGLSGDELAVAKAIVEKGKGKSKTPVAKGTKTKKAIAIPDANKKGETTKQTPLAETAATKKTVLPASVPPVTAKPKNESSSPINPPSDNPNVTKSGNYLTHQLVNPFADPSLDADKFIQYKSNKSFVSQSEDKGWETQFSGSKLKSQIKLRINQGVNVGDEIISQSGVKLTKKEVADLQSNRDKLKKVQSEVEKIDKAIVHPLVDSETAKNFKPSMSESEANKYTKNSFTGNLSFYHGNSQAVVDSITKDGAIPEKNTTGMYGQGFYLAASKTEAEYYAGTRQLEDTSVISTKVNVKNPYIASAQDIKDLKDTLFEASTDGDESKVITDFLKAKGHDSIYLKDMGYFVTFDTKQNVTYESNSRKAGTKVEIITDPLGNAAKSDTGKALLKAKNSK